MPIDEFTVVENLNISKEKFDEKLTDLLRAYSISQAPIEVSFREIVPSLTSDRSTHLIHTYPAKLLPHIPYIFLNNSIMSKPGDVILDPFCGSGTVLLEAILAGRHALGVDSNPIARLISTVKTTPYAGLQLVEQAKSLEASLKIDRTCLIPRIVNINHWFLDDVQQELGRLCHAIHSLRESRIKAFFLVCLSNCVKKVSLADPRVSVPVRLRYDQYKDGHPLKIKTIKRLQSLKSVDVKKKFFDIVYENIKRYDSAKLGAAKATVISKDARSITRSIGSEVPLESGSVDLVLTSPPYGGAQKYIRASSFSLGWIGELNETDLGSLEKESIGREHYKAKEYNKLVATGFKDADELLEKIYSINRLRSYIVGNYLLEMKAAIEEVYRVLKRERYFILVAANNHVCGYEFETKEYLKQISINVGFSVQLELIDDIKSYGLMTKRNKTASIITREWIIVLKKR